MKKIQIIITIALCSVLLSAFGCFTGMTAYAEATSGNCGDQLSWTLDDEGVLVISGIGPMYDYSTSNSGGQSCTTAPWGNNAKSVTIMPGVTSIGKMGFWNCTELRSISIPDTVISIGDYSCTACSIAEVSIPGSVASIGRSAFAYCHNLSDISLSEGLTSIGYSAFTECYNLKTVFVPNTVKYLGGSSFQGCTGLTTIKLPSSSASILDSTFQGCSSIQSVDIPDGVTSIGKNAFKDCVQLSYVSIPASVSTVGQYAFRNCERLLSAGGYGSGSDIEFGWDTSIPAEAFHTCNYLVTADLPDSISSIGGGAFYACSSLKSVSLPSNLQSIRRYAFYQCGNLEEAVLPDGLLSVDEYAFSHCSGLKKVRIPESTTSFGYSVFDGCDKLITAGPIESECNIEYGWKSEIPQNAFLLCGGLSTVTIPDGIVKIGSGAFALTNLKEVIFPNSLEIIDNLAFERCKISTLVLGENITTVGSGAFTSNENLLSVSVLNPAAVIGDGAFTNCPNLKSVSLPEDFSFANYKVFSGCPSLADENGFAILKGVLFGYYGGGQTVEIPDDVVAIGEFSPNDTAESVVIPASTRIIDSNAFAMRENLKEVIIPSGVTTIGEAAFDYCTKLETIYLPDSVLKLGRDVFRECSAITNIYMESIEAWLRFNSEEYILRLDDPEAEREIRLYLDGSEVTDLVIPVGTGAIPMSSFRNCIGIQSVSFPDTVMEIGFEAFRGCRELKEVAFSDSIQAIGDQAFLYCTSLKEIAIPDGICDISYGLFSGCVGLESVIIPATVTEVGPVAFHECVNLNHVYYTGTEEEWREVNVKWMNDPLLYAEYVFNYQIPSNEETSVLILPHLLTTIENEAFAGANAWKIIIPESVDVIEARAFADAKNLRVIYFEGSPFRIDNSILAGCGEVTIDCLKGSSAAKWANRQGLTVMYH